MRTAIRYSQASPDMIASEGGKTRRVWCRGSDLTGRVNAKSADKLRSRICGLEKRRRRLTGVSCRVEGIESGWYANYSWDWQPARPNRAPAPRAPAVSCSCGVALSITTSVVANFSVALTSTMINCHSQMFVLVEMLPW